MPITLEDVEAAINQEPVENPGGYADRDSLLYAVAIGLGRDPLDAKELEYVCESVGNRVVPTAATVLTRSEGARSNNPLAGKLNFALLLHGEQRLTIHQPLPQAAETLVSNRTVGVYDKGADKGALIYSEKTLTNKATGELIRHLTLNPNTGYQPRFKT